MSAEAATALRPRLAAGLAMVMLAGPPSFAQEPGPVLAPTLSFEVASVKVNATQTRTPMRWLPGGRFVMGLPIQSVLTIGYGVPMYRVAGAPDWVGTTFFDIDARADRQPTVDERRAYYRGLLEERFRLKAHVEQREMDVYALVLSRADGRLGPGLRRSTMDCDAVIAENRRRAEAGDPPQPPAPGQRPVCGSAGGGSSLVAGAAELTALVGMIAAGLDRPVLDRTGLTGRFDIDFRSAPMRVTAAPPPAIAELPSVFTAVQEQLGLRLETARAAVPVLVIDHIEMPTAN
jgi:uncharacterized protein (TIGR03435 family)